MKTFKQFTNESVRYKMIPKSDEDIKKSSEKLTPDEKITIGIKYNMVDLIKKGIEEKGIEEIEYDDSIREDLMHYSIFNNNMELAKLLIEHDLFTINYRTINFIINNGNMDIIKLLIKDKNISKTDILSSAIQVDNYDVVKYLISIGVEPTENELETAVGTGNNDIVQLLLDNDVHPNINILMNAIRNGRPKIVELLLKKGAYNEEALDYAIKLKNKKIIKLLKDYEKI